MYCTKCGGTLAPDGTCPNCAQAPVAQQPQAPYQQGYTPAPAPKAGINFQGILNDKSKLMTIISIVGTLAILALPILTVAGMLNITLFVLFSSAFSMVPDMGGLGMVGIILVLSVLAGGFSVYGALMKNKKFVLYGSAGAAGALLIFFLILNSAISSFGAMAGEIMEEFGAMGATPSVFNFLGYGFWIAVIAFVANIVISAKND